MWRCLNKQTNPQNERDPLCEVSLSSVVIKQWKVKHWLKWGRGVSGLIYCCLPQCRKTERWTNNWHSNIQFLMFSSCLFNDHFCDRLHKHMANRTRSKQLSSKSKLMFVILQRFLNVLKTYLRPSFLRNPMNFYPQDFVGVLILPLHPKSNFSACNNKMTVTERMDETWAGRS